MDLYETFLILTLYYLFARAIPNNLDWRKNVTEVNIWAGYTGKNKPFSNEHDVRTTLYGRCYDIKTFKRRLYNVVLTSCVGWMFYAMQGIRFVRGPKKAKKEERIKKLPYRSPFALRDGIFKKIFEVRQFKIHSGISCFLVCTSMQKNYNAYIIHFYSR